MRGLSLMLAATAIMTIAAAPSFADDMMMAKGATMMMMPDGKMAAGGTMDDKMAADMMKMAKPMDHCMMFMMGSDGKMYMMDDMKMSNGMMACDSMMKK